MASFDNISIDQISETNEFQTMANQHLTRKSTLAESAIAKLDKHRRNQMERAPTHS
jgi:hypothetical protein